MRVVNHNYTADEFQTLRLNTGPNLVEQAIGYLSTWAMHSSLYAECNIRIDAASNEIIASYRQEDGVRAQYVVAAVWHEDHFGFHS